ncbi:MAG: hypothetical protein ACTHMY_03480 [Solirubrobacteraceae bacterium]
MFIEETIRNLREYPALGPDRDIVDRALVVLEGTTALEPAYEVGDRELSVWHFPEGSAEDVWAAVDLIALDPDEVYKLLSETWPGWELEADALWNSGAEPS